MSYYNYIFKGVKVRIEDLQDEKDVQAYDEHPFRTFKKGEVGYDKLKEALGESTDPNSNFIVLQDIQEGSSYLRPSQLTFPEGTFIDQAGCFIKVSDMQDKINWSDLSYDIDDLEEALETYTKHLKDDKNLIVMAA